MASDSKGCGHPLYTGHNRKNSTFRDRTPIAGDPDNEWCESCWNAVPKRKPADK